MQRFNLCHITRHLVQRSPHRTVQGNGASDESGWKSFGVDILWTSAKLSNVYDYFDTKASSLGTRCKYWWHSRRSKRWQAQIFLTLQEVLAVRSLLRRRGLSVQSVRKVCKNSSTTVAVSIASIVTLLIASLLSQTF